MSPRLRLADLLVHAVGLVCGVLTLTVALALRGSILRPGSWKSCEIEATSAEKDRIERSRG